MPRKKSQLTAVTERFDRLAADTDLYHQNLIDYIQNHVQSKKDFDVIQRLLEAYVQLARCYYDQFRQSLLTKLQTLDEDQKALDTAIQSRQKQAVMATLIKASEATKLEYAQLLTQIPVLLQEALNKLAAEWERVYQVIIASRAARSEMKTFIDALTPVVRAAAHSVGIDASNLSVIPQIGSEFALQFFNYAGNFMVLSMSIFTLNAPWEWSIIWHEMAGHLVRQLKESEFEAVNQRLAQQAPYKQAFVHAAQRLYQLAQSDPQDLNPVEKELARHAETIIENMKALAAAGLGQSASEQTTFISQVDGYETNDRILDFHAQLQALRNEILRERGPDAYEEFLAYGWCDDWLEELFEDAFSARFFRRPFLSTFKRILDRFADGGKGLRHPPHKVRLLVAQRIIELTSNEEPDNVSPAAAMGTAVTPPDLPAEISPENEAAFVEDITIPDETEIEAGQPFVKTWRVENTGKHPWGKGFRLKFVQGSPLTNQLEHPLPEAKPGERVDISIPLTTPAEPGRHFGDWRFVDDAGAPFGATIFFIINVKEMPLEQFMISLVAKRIHHMLSLLARQTNQAQLDALQKYTTLVNESVTIPERIYILQPGDNLSRIGLRYGIETEKLAQINHLDNPNLIRAGQQIIVSEGRPLAEDVKKVRRLWQERPVIPPSVTSPAEEQAQAIGRIIREAMQKWLDNDTRSVRATIKQLSKFSDTPAPMSADAAEPEGHMTEAVSFYELIKTMDYSDLLGLSFTDVDFAHTNLVTLTHNFKNYKVLAQTWHNWQKRAPVRVKEFVPTDNLTGQIIVSQASTQWRMSLQWWSSARNSVPKLIRDG